MVKEGLSEEVTFFCDLKDEKALAMGKAKEKLLETEGTASLKGLCGG